MPTSLKNGFQVTKDTWHWIRVQETLSDSAVYGLTIGLALALPILILATQNIIIAILATLTISLVTVCVVGIIPMANWRLGVLESLNLCLVVGLSVDYVVHMAEAYHRCEHYGRNERVKHMLETVGSAVLSGAITTGGSAVFMLFAQIQFLVEFGVFILSTIGFSVLFSLLGFTVLMTICGPQGDTGSLIALFKRCFCKSEKNTQAEAPGEFNASPSTNRLQQIDTGSGTDNFCFVNQENSSKHSYDVTLHKAYTKSISPIKVHEAAKKTSLNFVADLPQYTTEQTDSTINKPSLGNDEDKSVSKVFNELLRNVEQKSTLNPLLADLDENEVTKL